MLYLAAENVKHLLSQCSAATDHWRELKLEDLIRNVVGIELSGSAVLEHLQELLLSMILKNVEL
jgi:hypothetical protein